MKLIEDKWGPFDEDEIAYYKSKLSLPTGEIIINGFQRDLIFNLFFSYFGDPESIKAINAIDYIKLVIASRRLLEVSGLIALPYIVSSRVTKLVTRKSINKKEQSRIEASPYYPAVINKYRNEKIIKKILGIIAVILSSDFEIIDYNDSEELDGKKIAIISEYIIEEVLIYTLLI